MLSEVINEFIEVEEATHNAAHLFVEETVVSIVKEIGHEQMELAILEAAAGKCKCADLVKALKEELAACYAKIKQLSDEIAELQQQHVVAFSEQSLVDDDYVQFYTRLPNLHILKSVFDHVQKVMPGERPTKLAPFQEFMCVLVKLRLNRFGLPISSVFIYCVENSLKVACPNGHEIAEVNSLA